MPETKYFEASRHGCGVDFSYITWAETSKEKLPKVCSKCGAVLIDKLIETKAWYHETMGHKITSQTYDICCPNKRWYNKGHETANYHKEVRTADESSFDDKLVAYVHNALNQGVSKKDLRVQILDRVDNNLKAIEIIERCGL